MIIKALLLATVFIAPIAANASETTSSYREVNGYTTHQMHSALNDRGIVAEHVEQWGQSIRVDAVNEAGRYFVMLDKDTLLPVDAKAAGTATSHDSGFKWLPTAEGAPDSLSENESDDTASNG